MASPTPYICVGLAGAEGVGKSALLNILLNNEFDLESSAQEEDSTKDLVFEHANIFKCSSTDTRGTCYRSSGGQLADMEDIDCDTHEERFSLSGRAAFVDCPGDLYYISTMLKGIMLADGVLILSQPTDGFAGSPTLDALAGAHLMGKSIVLVQIIKSAEDKKALRGHLKEIRKCCLEHLNISQDDDVPPMVEVHKTSALDGIGAVCKEVIGHMMPQLGASSSSSGAPAAFMLIASSSVVQPVGEKEVAAAAAAAAAGDAITFATIIGRVMQGTVSAGDEVEVRPGIMMKGDDGEKYEWCPIKLKVLSVRQNSEDEEEAEGNGLVALRASATIVNVGANEKRMHHYRIVGTVLGGYDGGLEGHVLGHPGSSLPDVYDALRMDFVLIPRMCDPYNGEPLPPVQHDEQLLLIIGNMATFGSVTKVEERGAKKKKKKTTIVVAGLSPPTWARYGERILICRPINLSWHLIGSGTVLGGGIPLDKKAQP